MSFASPKLPITLILFFVFASFAQAAFPAKGGRLRDQTRQAGFLIYKRAPSVSVSQESQFDSLRLLHTPQNSRDLGAGLTLEQFTLPPHGEESLADQMEATGAVEFAEPDYRAAPTFLPNDSRYTDSWHLPLIGAPAAWDMGTGTGLTVAILDTGVDPDHPDLASRLVAGWNFYDDNNDTSDIFGHGTAVAGVAAAIGNNALGVTGVAWNASIMPLRISDEAGYAFWSTMASGIIFAADNGARVANISYGDSCSGGAVISAAQYMRTKKGVVIVSAGNTGAVTPATPSSALTCVSATNNLDNQTSWSSFGPSVDVAAPGEGLWTTLDGGTYGPQSGTSFSAPLTAGIYTLMIAVNPALTSDELDNILFTTALDLGAAGRDDRYGFGRVDANAAVLQAINGPIDTTAPLLTSIGATGITADSATISWSTNEPATTQIEYGLTQGYGSSSPLDASLATIHSQTLLGLTPETRYHYRVKSKDASENWTTSTNRTFVTLSQPDTTAPVLSAIAPSRITSSAATLTWRTDEPATSEIEYGRTSDYGSTTVLTTPRGTSHSLYLYGLTAETLYHYRILAKDIAENSAASSDQTFTTTESPVTPTVTLQNNLFNPTRNEKMVIEVESAQTDPVHARVYNLGGTLVRDLGDGNEWDGRDDEGAFVRNGAYYCEIRYPGGRAFKKVTVLKR